MSRYKFLSSPAICAQLQLEYRYAAHEYRTEAEDEICLHVGDRIEVIAKDENNKLWWKGKNLDSDKVGMFPYQYTISAPLEPEYVYALYDFLPQDKDEIYLRKGHRIEVIEKFTNDWWRGKTSDRKVGRFPKVYVAAAHTKPEFVYAIYDFHPENDDEIRAQAGDRIEVIQKDEEYGDGWWQGRTLDGNIGIFPQNHTIPAHPETEYVQAVHDFIPENEDEIAFSVGELIEVIQKGDVYEDGWWLGKNRHRKFGLFPGNRTSPLISSVSTPIHADHFPALRILSKL